ncbi:MAG: pyridoxal phosphate-dependent aminotransferase [Spirochaetaceae bacterium]|jgi:aspartate aminotransferase|nr:pyridoxal phosphate-dependent aminotransferase [Spirochaetaceae bacterium]
MPIAKGIAEAMTSPQASAIRKMFEEGIALKKKYGEDAVCDFSLGNPDLEPPPEVDRAIRAQASLVQKGKHGYMPNPGYRDTRVAMAEKASLEQGVAVPPDNIVMTCGAAAALSCVFKAILEPQGEVIVPAPCFPDYYHYAANHGGRLIPVPARADFSLDVDAVQKALSPKTCAVLINSPNNPSGKIYTTGELAALAGALTEHGNRPGNRVPYLVADEPYRDIVYDGREVPALFGLYGETLTATSFAKNLSIPGERIGYIAVNPAASQGAQVAAACAFAARILGFVNAPAFFQRVVAAAWKCRPDFSSYRTRRDALMSALDGAGITYAVPEGAFYLFCKVPPRTQPGDSSDGAFCEHLRANLVLCAPGSSFFCPGWFRMAYCVPEKTIDTARDALKRAVERW